MNLFTIGQFVSHSGLNLSWKIDADALTDHDLSVLAVKVAQKFKFSRAIGIPRGGLRFAAELDRYASRSLNPKAVLLIADDVLTTGSSMEQMRAGAIGDGYTNVIGVVIFARIQCPSWIYPIFTLSSWVSP